MEHRQIVGLLERMVAIKEAIARMEEEKVELEKAIIEFLPQESRVFEYEDATNTAFRATVVYGSTVSFDIPSLKKELTKEMWEAVTTVVLDKKLLEDAVAREFIPLETVARNSIEKPSKPYIRISKIVSSRNDGRPPQS